jgi:hypothetical protein
MDNKERREHYRQLNQNQRLGAPVQNTMTSEVLCRALLTKDGAQRLEVARA